MSEKSLSINFYYKKSRLQQLKGFCYTVQEGSVTKASERMGLGVSTVTMQIKALEDDLNTKLFDRIKNRLYINEKGKEFYKMAIPLIQSADGLFERFLYESKEKADNEVRISAHHVVISHILPKYIKEFSIKFPKIKFILNNIDREEAYKQVANNEVDMAIYPIEISAEISEEIKYLKAFKYDLVLIMHKDHILAKKRDEDITRKDIISNNFIHMDKKMMTANSWFNIFDKKDLNSNIEMNNGSWEIVKEMVRQNIGISGMSKFYINKNDKDLTIKSVKNPFPDLLYCIFLKKEGFINKNSEEFLNLLKLNFNWNDN